MKRFLPTSLLLIALTLLAIIFVKPQSLVHSAANHIVISEIQTTGNAPGNTTTDEFVELYNPTSDPVEMDGWRLTRKTAGGTQNTLISDLSGTIPAFGYFLITHPDYDGSVAPDVTYSASTSAIASNNSVLLYSDAGTTVVDKVGFGTNVVDFETATFSANPASNGSIERKALALSTEESMNMGGSDEFLGNGNDTDDNSQDFIIRNSANPQNSSSTENPNPATPTPTAEPDPTEIPTPTEAPTPTSEPTPTEIPTPIPTEIPTPTPTLEPTPTITPTPFQTLGTFHFPNKSITCGWIFKTVRIGFFKVHFPRLVCS